MAKNENNKKLTKEDAKKWEWRLVGVTGERRLIKAKKRENLDPENQRATNSRGRIPSQRRRRDQLSDSEEEGTTRKKQC